jgi:hypothetical protein
MYARSDRPVVRVCLVADFHSAAPRLPLCLAAAHSEPRGVVSVPFVLFMNSIHRGPGEVFNFAPFILGIALAAIGPFALAVVCIAPPRKAWDKQAFFRALLLTAALSVITILCFGPLLCHLSGF